MKFALVGSVGFIADAVMFTVCFKLWLLPLLSARVVAFFVAATVTWLGNRWFTFKTHQGSQSDVCVASNLKQWLRFMVSACVSALPNFLVFKVILVAFGSQGFIPYIALILGVLVGMVSNYLLSSRWVFERQ
ncbi:GtrA family protein [Vibrio kasasachensis]|uniref:GtrA family protein n=1 Tax=Vibrio kasasachensis TaxID=2910248 RepID=UPI003D098C1D